MQILRSEGHDRGQRLDIAGPEFASRSASARRIKRVRAVMNNTISSNNLAERTQNEPIWRRNRRSGGAPPSLAEHHARFAGKRLGPTRQHWAGPVLRGRSPAIFFAGAGQEPALAPVAR